MTAAMNDVPPVDGWTVEDLEGLPEDGVRRELLDGVLHVSPSPAPNHQVIAARLMADEVVLAVEILSPSSQSMDRVMKPALYAKAGIPFYWLVELSGTFTIHTHKLEFDNEIYRPTGSFIDTVKLDEPWGIEIPLARLRPRHL